VPSRREYLTSVVGIALLAGCSSSEPDPSSDASTQTPTKPPLTRELPQLIVTNRTDRPQTLTLRVAPEGGTTKADSWDLSPGSKREVQSYPPLETDARVTAIVEGYESIEYDWKGAGGGALSVSITPDGLSMEPIIT
jgi:hypothetical protein